MKSGHIVICVTYSEGRTCQVWSERHYSSVRTHRRTDARLQQRGFSFPIHKTTIRSSAHAWTDPGCRYSGPGDCWTWLRVGPFGPAIRERDVHAAGRGYRNTMSDLRHVRQDHYSAGAIRDDRARFDDGDRLFRFGGRNRSAAGRASTADLSPLAELPEQRKPGV